MSNIEISPAETTEAEILVNIAIDAFEGNFKKYGHYPPGIESFEWHQDKIKNGLYFKIENDENIVGGIYLISHPNNAMKIEFIFISP